jgi:broad specificity phosphatase PhoE
VKLILVRHGETPSNRENRVQGITDIALSEHGHLQVRRLADSLRSEKIDAIYSSPLKRAYQTAAAIARFHGVTIETDRNLQEMNHGDFENVTIQELKEKHMPFLMQWIHDPSSVVMPNGESLLELQNRAWRTIQRIFDTQLDTLVVSHSMTIMTILCKIVNQDLSRARELRVDVASKTIVEYRDGKGTIRLCNDTSHLKDI